MSDPFKILEPTVISFSGGRTSAYMLWRVLQSNNGLPEEAVVCFANTGKEDESTLKFVNDCQKYWNVPIVWLEHIHEKPKFKVVSFETASRNGEPFELMIEKRKYLPNTFARFCTTELKVNTINHYLKSIGFDEYVTFVGIRADEPRRVAKMKNNKDVKETPLATANVFQDDVMKFWKEQPFDLELTTLDGNALLGNCDLCFLKKLDHKLNLVKQNPERVVWWAKMEKKIGGQFRQDHPTYESMMNFVDKQVDLFQDETIPCFCGD